MQGLPPVLGSLQVLQQFADRLGFLCELQDVLFELFGDEDLFPNEAIHRIGNLVALCVMLCFLEFALGRFGIIPFAEQQRSGRTDFSVWDQFVLTERSFKFAVDLLGRLPLHRQTDGSGQNDQFTVVVNIARAFLRQQKPDRVTISCMLSSSHLPKTASSFSG